MTGEGMGVGLGGSRFAPNAFLAGVGLAADIAEQRVRTYSKGMRQNVGIATAIAKRAKALLLDEPTADGRSPLQASSIT